MEDFADYLRFFRRRGGFTQKGLAKALKVSPSTITNWEQGYVKRPRHREDILRLANVLDLKEDETDRLLTVAGYPIEFGSADTSAPSSSTNPAPFQLPARASHFVGRNQEMNQLADSLRPGTVVTLCGPGGVGKTALVTEALHRLYATGELTRRFPDGVLFHDFYAQPKIELALEQIAIAYSEVIRPTSRAAVQRVLTNRRILLFLDGAENADDLNILLGIRSNCGLVVTSQRRENAVDLRLDIAPLPSHEARRLLEAWTPRGAENLEAVNRICEIVGHLPLAVRLIGRYLNSTGETATEYLEWLEKKPIQALSRGLHREENVKRLFENSLARLNEATIEVLSLIGSLSLGPFTMDIPVNALQMTSIEVRRHLGELVDYGFLVREGGKYWVAHALIHTYAKGQLKPAAEALERLAQHFMTLGTDYCSARDPSILDDLKPHIMALSASLERHNLDEPNVLLAHVMTRSKQGGYLQIRGFWDDEETLLQRAVIASSSSQWAQHLAHLKLALGDLYLHKGQYNKATEHFRASSTGFRQIEKHDAQLAESMIGLGEAHFRTGNESEAIEAFRQCICICSAIDELKQVEALAYAWLGRVHHFNELFEEAEIAYIKSLELFGDEGYYAERAFCLVRLATLAHDKLSEDMTRTYLDEATSLLDNIEAGSPLISEIRRELANQYLWKWNKENVQDWKWDIDRAKRLHQNNLRELERVGNKEQIAWTLQNLGDTYFEGGELEKAKAHYQKALDYFEELGIFTGKGYALDHLGQINLREDNIDGARQLFLKSLATFQISGLNSGIGWSLYNLGEVERLAGNIQAAYDYYAESETIWKKLKHERSMVLAHRAIDRLNQP